MPHRLITTPDKLAAFCDSLKGVDYMAIDTEFIRERTYYPQLCLIQVAGPEAAYAIDPLAEGMDLSPLLALLADERLLKVFHAGRQDIEIFHLLTGKIPAPLYNTQIAAQVCGFGESVSYAELIKRITGANIDKASRFTDWARRPLSEKQIEYALGDVTHLRKAYEKLRERIAASGREQWTAEELSALTDPALYTLDPRDAWKRIKAGNLKPKQLAALRELAAWREQEARTRDLPRPRILKDEAMVEIAASLPETEEQISHVRGMGHVGKSVEAKLLACVRQALAMPPGEWPKSEPSRRSEAEGDSVAMLQLLLKLQCAKADVTPRLVAGRDDIEALATGQDTPALHGWRYDLFGHAAQQLMAGKLTIGWDEKKGEVAIRVV